jgi:hypothetical protein
MATAFGMDPLARFVKGLLWEYTSGLKREHIPGAEAHSSALRDAGAEAPAYLRYDSRYAATCAGDFVRLS